MNENLLRPLEIPIDELSVAKSSSASRIGGHILDGVIETTIMTLLGFSILYSQNGEGVNIAIVVLQIISITLNLIVPTFTKGQTLGKMAAKTRIISTDGNVGNLVIFLIRGSFFSVIAALAAIQSISTLVLAVYGLIYFICFIQLSTDSNGRTLQDRFARTVVVNDEIWKKIRYNSFYKIDHPEEFTDVEQEVNAEYYDDKANTEEMSYYGSIEEEEEIK